MKATAEELQRFIESDQRYTDAFLAWQREQERYRKIYRTKYLFTLKEAATALRMSKSGVLRRCKALGIPRRTGNWLFTDQDVQEIRAWKGGVSYPKP